MTFSLPCVLVTQILNAAGFTDVNYTRMENRAISPPIGTPYVFLEDLPGTTPHIPYSNIPSMQIVVYAAGNDDVDAVNNSLRASMDIQAALGAARGVPFPEGGLHRVRTRVSPNRQDIAGIPYGCGRTVAQYDFIISNKEKWS